jgi:RNA polymerase sigma-B factor
LFRRLQALDEGSPAYQRQRAEIITRCIPLADNIARRFKNRGEPLDDLVQAARMGLVNAVNRFDVDNGAEFLGFAVPTIMGEVRRHFRDHGWAVKVPRRLKELQGELNRARAELSQSVGRAPTATELARHLDIDRETVVETMIAGSNYSTMSTDVRTDSDDQRPTLGETIGEVDDRIDLVVELESVRPLVNALSERHRTVLTLRFFEDMTQSQIAERIGCSQMHVSRLLTQALGILRKQMLDDDSQLEIAGRRSAPFVGFDATAVAVGA